MTRNGERALFRQRMAWIEGDSNRFKARGVSGHGLFAGLDHQLGLHEGVELFLRYEA